MNRGVLSFYQPSGRFGNQLFQLHFLRQIKKKFNFQLIHGRFRDLEDFEYKKIQIDFSKNVLKKPKVYRPGHVIRIGFDEFEHQMSELSKNKKHVNIQPGFLGQFLSETQYFPTAEIFPLIEVDKKVPGGKKKIAIHFRGTDFQSWDPYAIMDFSYYMNSIEEVIGIYGRNEVEMKMFTDDPNHETVQQVLKFSPIDIELSNRALKLEFLEMCSSDVIIHSPSTFSFWASLIGEQKVNVYSKSWVEYKIENHDKFWSDFKYKGFSFSRIDLEI